MNSTCPAHTQARSATDNSQPSPAPAATRLFGSPSRGHNLTPISSHTQSSRSDELFACSVDLKPLAFCVTTALAVLLLQTGVVRARGGESSSASSASVTLAAGPDWIPLHAELDIEPGSALDFSAMGFSDAPAGKHGRVIARPDGQFAFADSPETPRRFYGVNLCFGAQYIEPAEADRLADRLERLGYNALRIHHYERDLTDGQSPTTRLNPAKLEQFDRLMAALIKRGIYLTTDLYVSRSVPWREIGVDRDGRIPMDTFKILVPVHEGAFENWKQFARALLDHTNPHTGRRYADEPALAWLAMINEGNFGNFYRDLRTIPEWTKAWNRWLAQHYTTRTALAQAWKQDLKDSEDPATGTVALPDNLRGEGPRPRDCIRFLSDTERDMVERMKKFLRDELRCDALISNASSWTYFVTDQAARNVYDYVDDHFYVDHPQFLEGSWRLPSRCPNTSPLAEGATGGRSKCFTRLADKPFTITEYNYSGPGRFRGVGGILTGALGALQGWGGIWRFAYSHSRSAIFIPSPMGYFDLASDPLSQAAERASLCLFLRGDLHPAPHSISIAMSEADLASPAARIPNLHPQWHWAGWVTRLGTRLARSPADPLPEDILFPLGWQTPASAWSAAHVQHDNPYAITDTRLTSLLRSRNIIGTDNPTDPARRLLRSETGEITIDGPNNKLILDTARTAGGYAPAGQTIAVPNAGVQIAIQGSDATVWVSALDEKTIRDSRRLLVTHLTDLQNTGIRYREEARQTLLAWGGLPHLVRSGRAEVSVKITNAADMKVWALSTGGRRLLQVPVKKQGDIVLFIADVAASSEHGALMLYEVADR